MSAITAVRLERAIAVIPPSLTARETIDVSVSTDMRACESEWRSFEPGAVGHIYQSFDWISSWLATVGRRQGVRPHIVLARGLNGRVLFLLPLGVMTKHGAEVLVWLGGKEASVKNGLFAPDFLENLEPARWASLWQRIKAQLPHVDALYLVDQPEDIHGRRNPFIGQATHRIADRVFAVQLTRDWNTFYAEKRSTNARSLERRRMKKLAALGKIRLEIADEPQAIAMLAEKLFAEKSKALAAMGAANPFAAKEALEFYRHLAPLGISARAAPAKVHVSALTVDGVPTSMVWGYVFNGCYYYVIPTYDPKLQRLSPGRLHLAEIFRWCIEHGLSRVDLGPGDQPYKFDWCDERTALFASVSGHGLRGRFVAAALGTAISAKCALKSSKTFWPLLKTLRAKLGRPAVGGAE